MIAKVPRGPMPAYKDMLSKMQMILTNPDNMQSDRQCWGLNQIYGWREQLLAAVKLQQSALFIKSDFYRL